MFRRPSSVIYTQLTGVRTMRLDLKGGIAKIFDQTFVGDAAGSAITVQ